MTVATDAMTSASSMATSSMSGGSQILRSQLRECDVLARIGGEEFAVLLPETDVAGAIAVAERLRHATAAARVSSTIGDVAWTVSIGVTELAAGDGQIEDLLRRADLALYQAKEAGRNRIMVLAAAGEGERSSPDRAQRPTVRRSRPP